MSNYTNKSKEELEELLSELIELNSDLQEMAGDPDIDAEIENNKKEISIINELLLDDETTQKDVDEKIEEVEEKIEEGEEIKTEKQEDDGEEKEDVEVEEKDYEPMQASNFEEELDNMEDAGVIEKQEVVEDKVEDDGFVEFDENYHKNLVEELSKNMKFGLGGNLVAGSIGAYLGAKYPKSVKKVTDPLDKAYNDIKENLTKDEKFEKGGVLTYDNLTDDLSPNKKGLLSKINKESENVSIKVEETDGKETIFIDITYEGEQSKNIENHKKQIIKYLEERGVKKNDIDISLEKEKFDNKQYQTLQVNVYLTDKQEEEFFAKGGAMDLRVPKEMIEKEIQQLKMDRTNALTDLERFRIDKKIRQNKEILKQRGGFAKGGLIKQLEKLDKESEEHQPEQGYIENYEAIEFISDKTNLDEEEIDEMVSVAGDMKYEGYISIYDVRDIIEQQDFAKGGEIDYGKVRENLKSLDLPTDTGDRTQLVEEIYERYNIDCSEVVRGLSDDDVYVAVDGVLRDYGVYASDGYVDDYTKGYAKGGSIKGKKAREFLLTQGFDFASVDDEGVIETANELGYKYDENKKEWTFAKGGKVKRYIVHKGSGYDGEVVGSSDTFRGASMIQKRLEKKGVFDDVDTYGIKDTQDYFYRRKDNKYKVGGELDDVEVYKDDDFNSYTVVFDNSVFEMNDSTGMGDVNMYIGERNQFPSDLGKKLSHSSLPPELIMKIKKRKTMSFESGGKVETRYEVELIENVENNPKRAFFIVNQRTFDDLERLQNAGGFRRYEIDLYDDDSEKNMSNINELDAYIRSIGISPEMEFQDGGLIKETLEALEDSLEMLPGDIDIMREIDNLKKRL